jgi:integrase
MTLKQMRSTEMGPAVSRYAEKAAELWAESAGTVEDLLAKAKAPATLKGYASDWRQFAQWAQHQGLKVPEPFDGVPIPSEVVALYIGGSAGIRKPATVTRHLAAIRFWHHKAGLASPTDHPGVREMLEGFAREYGSEPDRAAPLFLEELRAGLPPGDSPRAIRDRAILLVGFWSALRRSELVALTLDDIQAHPEGMVLTLRKSKTDQTSKGRKVAVHYREDSEICPVRSIREHLAQLVEPESVFPISDRTVARIVKRCAARAGLDPAGYSAHSLRAGFVSECDRRRVPTSAVRAVTGHSSDSMLSVYSRPGDLFDGSAGAWFD